MIKMIIALVFIFRIDMMFSWMHLVILNGTGLPFPPGNRCRCGFQWQATQVVPTQELKLQYMFVSNELQ